MSSSNMIALFADPPPARRGPSAFLVSVFVHGCVCGLVFLWMKRPQEAEAKHVPHRYEVRIMELQQTEPRLQWHPPQVVPRQSDQMAAARTAPAAPSGGSAGQAAAPRIPIDLAKLKQVTQTLVQPDAQNVAIPEAALPQVMVWSARDITVKKIVTAPQKTVAAIATRPSLDAPNQASRIADIRISPTTAVTKAPLPAPSTTSPMNTSAPVAAARVPETASKVAMQVVPTSVISLSDVQLKEGTVALPPVNEVSVTVYKGPLSPGQPNGAAQASRGPVDSKQNGTGAGPGVAPGNGTGNVAATNGPAGQNGVGKTGTVAGGNGALGDGTGIGFGDSGGYTVARVRLPQDGKFGVVVVGSSIAEDYPETVGIWSGRLAYTVYLHVGAAKNWVLQYSLPRSQDAGAAGAVARLEAPWPYDILRPSIDPDTNTDAIMVHGFVNAAGHFDKLAVVFPNGLAEAQFLLHALQQWEFRPALQNGQKTPVEVLLIIPCETD